MWVLLVLFLLFIFKKILLYKHTLFITLQSGIKIIKPFLTWRILLCYLPFWFVFTGWTYIALAIGNVWWKTVAGVWLAWMWMPWCPEKLITIPLTIWLHKKLFPNRDTTDLDSILEKEKASVSVRKLKRQVNTNSNSHREVEEEKEKI